MPKCPKCGKEMGSALSLIPKGQTDSVNGKEAPKPVSRCTHCGFTKKNRRAETSQAIPPMPKIVFR